jgi:hypothetical protein
MTEEEQKIPQYLYHYYKVDEYTEAIFSKNEIYFDSPLNYNDPFDTKILFKLTGTPQQQETFLTKKCGVFPEQARAIINIPSLEIIFEPKLNQLFDNCVRATTGIYCLSEKKNNILMWAHYADSHRGFCLEFSINNCLFKPVFPCDYNHNNSLPVAKPAEEDFWVNEKTFPLFLKKAKDWGYEEEWRVLKPKEGPGVYLFPSEALTGVILGYRMTYKNKIRIINWCRHRNPRPQLYNAIPKETKYGLDITPTDYHT